MGAVAVCQLLVEDGVVFEDPAETGEVAEASGLARGRWAVHDEGRLDVFGFR